MKVSSYNSSQKFVMSTYQYIFTQQMQFILQYVRSIKANHFLE